MAERPVPIAPIRSRFYARVFALCTAAALAVLLFMMLTPFVSPILWAALLAFMLEPFRRAAARRFKTPNTVAVVVTSFASVVILGPVGGFVFAFVRQASDLLRSFQAEAADRRLPALQLVLEFEPVQRLLNAISEFSSLSKEQILQQAATGTQEALQQVASISSTVVLGLFSVIVKFALTMFLLFFLVRDGRDMLALGMRLVPLPAHTKADLQTKLGNVTHGIVMGTLITAVVQGSLIGIGFALVGLPSPLVFGAFGALASLVPVVGTTLVWVPATISLFATNHSGAALFLLAWSAILVAGSDNIIRPLVVSSSSNVSTLLVFMGVLGGVGAFGPPGIFVGPFVLTLVVALLTEADVTRKTAIVVPATDTAPRDTPVV